MDLAELLPEEAVERHPLPEEPPPVVGAQWDEVHACWERWDPTDGRWHVVGSAVDLARWPADPLFVIDLRDSVEVQQELI